MVRWGTARRFPDEAFSTMNQVEPCFCRPLCAYLSSRLLIEINQRNQIHFFTTEVHMNSSHFRIRGQVVDGNN